MTEIEIPIGPQHPALKEPVSFRVFADGERVVRLELDVSYNHRGIEKGAESRDLAHALYLIERICGICSHAHTTTFVQGVETLMGIEAPPRARYLRTLVAELERIHSHLLWLGVAAHEIGYNTLFMLTWRDRERVQDLLEALSGNRVNYGMNTIGGVRRDLGPELAARALDDLAFLGERADAYVRLAATDSALHRRMRGVGVLPKETAIALGAVGPTARGSGVDEDVRRDDPYAAYGEVPFHVVTSDRCDVLGRAEVRVRELVQSVRIARHVVEHLPEGEVVVKAPRRVPPGEHVSRYEAPRGELLHYLVADGSDKLARLGVRTPTLANWPSVVAALEGRYLADVPVIVAAIDPCLSCTSRMTIARGDGPVSSMTWDELVEHGIRFYEGKEAPP